MTGIGAPHARYGKVRMDDKTLDYDPENPDAYMLFKGVSL